MNRRERFLASFSGLEPVAHPTSLPTSKGGQIRSTPSIERFKQYFSGLSVLRRTTSATAQRALIAPESTKRFTDSFID